MYFMQKIFTFLFFYILLLSQLTTAATYTVLNCNDSGAGSLRQAVIDANAAPGADNIYFNIPDTDPAFNATNGTWSITLLSQLPIITTGSINIDATSQESNQGNRNIFGYEIILLKGGTFDYPFLLVSPGNAVKGFIIQGFPYGIMIYNSTATGNTISQNYIGTNFSATAAAANPNQYGIAIANGASGNTISGNIISGNSISGIAITGSNNNTIKNNHIGTDSSGTFAIANNFGIAIQDASGNIIGGLNATEFNLISGNTTAGIVIDGLTSTNNSIFGNRIGCDINGTDTLPNESGIILSCANYTQIGGSTYSHRNIISGNTSSGIVLNGTGTRMNSIKGNFIGADITGMNALSNYGGIIIKSNAHSNFIGGVNPAERNIISANIEMGIYIEASDSNLIVNNLIGPDSSGTDAFYINGDTLLQGNGIEFNTVAKHNTLGGYTSQERNIVSGNRVYGMVYYGNCSYNPVIGNYIGTDISGNNPLPNATGICVDGGSNNNPIINNVLSGNYSYGIFIVTIGTYYNTFTGNIVGLNANGTDTIPNDAGLLLGGGTKYNTIGGNTSQDRNIISGNRYGGIEISDIGTSENIIQGNYIGTDISGLNAKPNQYGISILSYPKKNTIDANVISGNVQYGILIFEYADSNLITCNYIGPGADSLAKLGNGTAGIVLWDGSSNNIIGGENMGNVIAFHDTCGIAVKDNNTLYNTISENSIYNNSFMGIEIFPEGPNSNDAGDIDSGPNELMNFPIITHAAYNSSSQMVWIYGTLDTQNADSTLVELFIALADSTLNNGEGQTYIGHTHPESNGDWMYYGLGINDGQLITATATNKSGSTSEFAQNFTIIASVNNQFIEHRFQIYPNPSTDNISIRNKKQENIESFKVFSIHGKLIYEKTTIESSKYIWNFGNSISAGRYFIQINSKHETEILQFEVIK